MKPFCLTATGQPVNPAVALIVLNPFPPPESGIENISINSRLQVHTRGGGAAKVPRENLLQTHTSASRWAS